MEYLHVADEKLEVARRSKHNNTRKWSTSIEGGEKTNSWKPELI